jgi:TatD DNase family protein
LIAVDTHVHLESYLDVDAELAECRRRGVLPVVATTRPSEYRRAIAAYGGRDDLRVGLGLHPEAAGSVYAASEFAILEALFPAARWISEVGLDAVIAEAAGSFFGSAPTLTDQEQLLERILALGVSGKTLSVHSRGAEARMCDLLQKAAPRGAIFHWYRGDLDTARRVVQAGYLLSVNIEMVTDAESAELLRWIPVEALALETDGPFTALPGGGWSRPADVVDVIDLLAELRGEDRDALSVAMLANFARVDPGV